MSAKSVQSEHYSRLPDSVLEDRELSAAAKCVYAFLAGRTYQGTTSSVGVRRIGERIGLDKSTVCRALHDLSERGHISVIPWSRLRSVYHLESPLFGQKQRSGTVEELVSSPAGHRRLASVRTA